MIRYMKRHAKKLFLDIIYDNDDVSIFDEQNNCADGDQLYIRPCITGSKPIG